MKAIPQHTLTFLDSWLTFQVPWIRLPGLAVVIAKDGKIVFNKAYGFANKETGERLTTDHVFRIASQSKTFTSTSLLQLVEKGALKLDDPIAKHLTWLKDHKDAQWHAVTVRQLLSHSAGVIRDGEDSNYWQLKRPFPDSETLKADLLSTDLVKTPNTKMKYSNYGFSLLGLLIEQLSGQTYEEYVQEHIIQPLKLTSTTSDIKDGLNYVKAYSRLTLSGDRHPLPNPATNAMATATGFSSTPADLATYYSAQLLGTGKLLSDESKHEMQRIQWPVEGSYTKTWYSLGLERIKRGKREMIGHGGGFPGTITETAFDNDDGLVVSVFMNGGGYIGDIIDGIISTLDALGEAEPDASLLKYEGRFSTLWGVYQVVATGDGLRAVYPTSWYPFGHPDKLDVVDDATLKVTETDGFSSEGELIHYTFKDDGSIDHIVDAGSYSVASEDGDVPITWE
jgi:CubicO group peptidase (beta-lactamase class C family)